MRWDRARWACLVVLTLAATAARAERLPVRWYSAPQGLPGGPVNRIFRDSKGFVWSCTGEGVARFDGYAFTTFGVDDGLPSSIVLDVLERPPGDARGSSRQHEREHRLRLRGILLRDQLTVPGRTENERSVEHSYRLSNCDS